MKLFRKYRIRKQEEKEGKNKCDKEIRGWIEKKEEFINIRYMKG